MPKKKKVGDNSLSTFESGTEGVAATTNYQQVLAEYDENSRLVSFIAPDGTRYFISGQAGVNQLIAGANVTLTPPSGQGNVTIDVAETGTVQSVAARWVDGTPTQPIVVNGSPITTSGVLQFDYGTGQFPPQVLGAGPVGRQDYFLNSSGQFTEVIGTATPFLRFNGSALGGFNQTFTDPILTIYNATPELLTVLANGVALTPPTISPASAGSYRLTGDVITITDYLEPNALIEVISKVVIGTGDTVGTVKSIGLTAPQGLRQSVPPITNSGTLALLWDTGVSFIPQSSLGIGTIGSGTVLIGGANNASWQPYMGALVDTQSTQTLRNKTLDGVLSINTPMPINPDNIATKEYVDTVALGLTPYQVFLATIDPLPGVWTYNNGVNGVGATLTSANNIALNIDGATGFNVGFRILVKDQVDPIQNGIYTITQVGDAVSPYVLTRATDYDLYPEVYHSIVNITTGDTLASSTWITDVPATGAIGTTNINYILYSGVATTTPVAKGGTGRTSLDANRLLVGNAGDAIISVPNIFVDVNGRIGINTVLPTVSFDLRNTGRVQQVFEKINVDTTALNGIYNVDLSNGVIYLFTTPATGNFIFNFQWLSSTVNAQMQIGDAISSTLITNQNATPFYANQNPRIDGVSTGITTIWQGVARPSFGNANSRDIYTFTIIKTADATYTVLAVRAQYGGI